MCICYLILPVKWQTVFRLLCHCAIVTMWNTRIILSAPLRFVYGYNWCLQHMQEESNNAKGNSYSISNRKSVIAHRVTALRGSSYSSVYDHEVIVLNPSGCELRAHSASVLVGFEYYTKVNNVQFRLK